MAEQDVMGALRGLLECARRGEIDTVPSETWSIVDAINRGDGPEITDELDALLGDIEDAFKAIDEARMFRLGYDLIYLRPVGPKTADLWRSAYGDEYPDGLETLGYTTLSMIGRFVDELGLASGDVFLDLGCGRGGIGLEIARRTGARVVSSDFSRSALLAARRIARDLGGAAHAAVAADMTSVPLRDASMDAVACVDTIEVAASRLVVLEEIARVLVPGGKLVLTAMDVEPGADVIVPRLDRVENTAEVAQDAGLEIIAYEEIAGWRDGVRRLYTGLLDRAAELKDEMGASVVADLAHSGGWMLEHLHDRRYVLVVARRPD